QLAPPDSPESARTVHTVERLDAIQQHFQRQGAGWEVLLAVLVAVGIVLLAILFQAIQEGRRRTDVHRPAKLFRRLLPKLGLTVPQRDLLRRMAADLRLDNATVLLLSRRIFDRQVRRWLERVPHPIPDADARLAQLAEALYPSRPANRAISTTKGGGTKARRLGRYRIGRVQGNKATRQQGINVKGESRWSRRAGTSE
ncbi:MAG: hypothetical protein ACE5GE_16475, partial [Phycisphaerae bacterium]